MAFTWWEAAIIALYYWFCWWDFAHPLSGVAWAQDCVWIGLIMGLAFGDVNTGIVIGGTVALTFICALPVGANLPVDYAAAALAAVSMAIKFHWSAGMSICIAVFFGIGGAKLDGIRRTTARKFNDMARKHIRERHYGMLFGDAVLFPILWQFVLRAIPMFVAVFFGSKVFCHFNQWFPTVLLHSLEVAGKILPGLGIALCLNTVGKVNLFPFFIIGYFAYFLVGGSTLVYAVIALCIAISIVSQKNDGNGNPFDKALFHAKIEDDILTRKDHFWAYFRFLFIHRCSQAMDTFYGTGYVFANKNALRKIYKDDEQYQKAMERNLEPYIPEAVWGSAINGIAMHKEEDIAKGDNVTNAESISTLKTSLMGPVAGFGDCINYMVFWNFLKMCFYPLAASGSFLGLMVPVILHPVLEIIGWIAYKAGYVYGPKGILGFLKSNLKNKILETSSITGSLLLGVIACAHVKFDVSFVPSLSSFLPFAVTTFFYICLRKGKKFLPMMVWTMAIVIVLAFCKLV